MQVELLPLQPHDVPRIARQNERAGRAERLSQLRYTHLQRRPPGLRRILAPQLVDQTIGGHNPVGVQQQNRQQRALLGTGERDQRVAVGDLKRAENPELHLVSTPLAPRQRTRAFSLSDRRQSAISTKQEESCHPYHPAE